MIVQANNSIFRPLLISYLQALEGASLLFTWWESCNRRVGDELRVLIKIIVIDAELQALLIQAQTKLSK